MLSSHTPMHGIQNTNLSLIPSFIRTRVAHRPNLIKIADNVSWLFFDKLLRMGVGLFIGVWIARYLGPEQFGLLSFATAFVGLFGAIASLGLQGIVVRDLVCNPGGARETLGTAAVLQLIGGLVAYLLMLVVFVYLRPEDTVTRTIVAILGSMMLLEASKVAVFWFESQVQSKYTVWVQNGAFLVFAAVKVLLILQQASLVDFAWATLAEALITAIILLYIMNLRGLSMAKLRVSTRRGLSLLRDSWPLIFSAIAITIYMKIDQIMLGQMIGDEAVGIYSAATRISEAWYFIPTAIVASVFPAILEAKKISEEQYYGRLQKLYDLMVLLSVAVAIPLTFFAAPIVTLVFGETYAEAAPVLAIHIWASVFIVLGISSGQSLLAENRLLLSLQRTALGCAANVILNLFLIPKYQTVGAAIATVISFAVAALLADLLQRVTHRMFFMKLSSLNPVAVLGRHT